MRGEGGTKGRGGLLKSLVLVRKDLAEEVNPRPNHKEFGFHPEENEQPSKNFKHESAKLTFVFRNKMPGDLLGALW